MLRHWERKTQTVTAGVYTQPCQSHLASPKASRILSSESRAAKYNASDGGPALHGRAK